MASFIVANPSEKSVTAEPSASDSSRSMFDGLDRSHLINEPMAARILSLKPDTVRKARKAGRGPRFVRLGRSIRYRLPDLEAFILSHLAEVDHA